MIYYNTFDSIIGKLFIAYSNLGLCKISINDEKEFFEWIYQFYRNEKNIKDSSKTKVIEQLRQYFNRELKYFNCICDLKGTEFQKKVWLELTKIPYGKTKSYKEIAIAIGNKEACRAIGIACNKNPIPIIIPCHRVIGSNGKLIGYAHGIEIKKKLLDLEK